MYKAETIEATLLKMADKKLAEGMMRFFKTAPGEYAEGDIFAGLRNPQVRAVVKDVWKETSLSEVRKLVQNRVHEVRLCGLLIMVEQYLKAMKTKDHPLTVDIFCNYIALHHHINNWDLVDLSAIKIVGNHEVLNPDVRLMNEWINHDNHTIWQQRIAMVSTWMLIRYQRPNLCFERAEVLLDGSHDLLHKAAGWMLREAWKAGYREKLRNFLSLHIGKIPSVMLSYACEQMSVEERKRWQSVRKKTIKYS